MGGNRRTDPAESSALLPWDGARVGSAWHGAAGRDPALLQESLRCFFCSWYSAIFRWK